MNFEKYRKKKHTVKATLDDATYNAFINFLKSENLTQQAFFENKIKEILKKITQKHQQNVHDGGLICM